VAFRISDLMVDVLSVSCPDPSKPPCPDPSKPPCPDPSQPPPCPDPSKRRRHLEMALPVLKEQLRQSLAG
jgi:hypothetical protein